MILWCDFCFVFQKKIQDDKFLPTFADEEEGNYSFLFFFFEIKGLFCIMQKFKLFIFCWFSEKLYETLMLQLESETVMEQSKFCFQLIWSIFLTSTIIVGHRDCRWKNVCVCVCVPSIFIIQVNEGGSYIAFDMCNLLDAVWCILIWIDRVIMHFLWF